MCVCENSINDFQLRQDALIRQLIAGKRAHIYLLSVQLQIDCCRLIVNILLSTLASSLYSVAVMKMQGTNAVKLWERDHNMYSIYLI